MSISRITENQNKLDDLHATLVCGLEFLDQKEYKKSQKYIKAVLSAQPNNPELMHLLGIINYQLDDLPEALSYLSESVELNPSNCKAQYNLGLVYYDLHRLEDAIESYTKAIALNPQYCDALSNRGAALFELNRLNEAFVDLKLALQIDPNHTNSYINLANTFQIMHRMEDALFNYQKAIDHEPENAIAHWGYATSLLQIGDYKKGFEEFEWRIKNKRLSSLFTEKFNKPAWTGKESLENKTILLHSEQGLGDTIQFCRYITKVNELGAKILISAEEPILELLSDIDGVNEVYTKGSEFIPSYDYHCSLLSLPFALETDIQTIPSTVPYLSARSEKKLAWCRKLGPKTRPRVGLVWSGGFRPNNPELHAVNGRRNIPLEKFKNLEDLDIDFYSLQKGIEAENELKIFKDTYDFGKKIINHTKDFYNFSDTAAFIENLDLVISVDTSTAHLAGALNKPVWILNRFDNCWRWLLDRNDSPWYPSARLFRQNSDYDWDTVISEVKIELIRNFITK